MVYRGYIHQRKLIVEEPVELPDGTEVRVEIESPGAVPAAASLGDGQRPIEEVLAALAAGIPDAEWNKLPTDLSSQIDHYVYGLPKR